MVRWLIKWILRIVSLPFLLFMLICVGFWWLIMELPELIAEAWKPKAP